MSFRSIARTRTRTRARARASQRWWNERWTSNLTLVKLNSRWFWQTRVRSFRSRRRYSRSPKCLGKRLFFLSRSRTRKVSLIEWIIDGIDGNGGDIRWHGRLFPSRLRWLAGWLNFLFDRVSIARARGRESAKLFIAGIRHSTLEIPEMDE